MAVVFVDSVLRRTVFAQSAFDIVSCVAINEVGIRINGVFPEPTAVA